MTMVQTYRHLDNIRGTAASIKIIDTSHGYIVADHSEISLRYIP